MLFLFNDRILSVPNTVPCLDGLKLTANEASIMPINSAIISVQRAFIRNPNLMADEPQTSEAAAWLLAVRSEINAALFVPKPRPRVPEDVPFRTAKVSAVTLGKLAVLEQQGKITVSVINQSVWLAAA